MSYADKTLVCRDCGQEFTFTAGEQEFYASRGLQNEPGRCPSCRQARKAQRAEGASYSANAAVAPRAPRQYFIATCARCGNEARLPFQPVKEKPVYCSSCFDVVRAGNADAQ